MFQLSKFHIVASFLLLAALRIAIGFHFFDQGYQKFRKGGFDATGFLQSADGRFAPLFHSLIPDHDGKIRLCYDPQQEGFNKINPEPTLKVWEAYKNFVVDELIDEEERLSKPRKRLKEQIETLDPTSSEYLVAVNEYNRGEEVILAIRKARELGTANRIFEDFKEQLLDYLAAYEEDINFYFLGEERLEGFKRDYNSTKVTSGSSAEERIRKAKMRQAARNVNLLRDQVDTIQSDRWKAAGQWLAAIDGLWAGFEYELLNMVPLDEERQAELALQKPNESPSISFINRYVPYFDAGVGLLLIVGLFTRIASFAAGTFLISILMTQPAILGEAAAPTTILYFIEMLAAFVVFATCAGRYAGLDYFIHAGVKKVVKSENEDFV